MPHKNEELSYIEEMIIEAALQLYIEEQQRTIDTLELNAGSMFHRDRERARALQARFTEGYTLHLQTWEDEPIETTEE